jgi:addiction module RelB/DinJ family antitoxin
MQAKETYIRAKVDPALKKESEQIFSELGLTTDAAISLFLNQVKRHRGLPFRVVLSDSSTDDDFWSDEIRQESLDVVYDDKPVALPAP